MTIPTDEEILTGLREEMAAVLESTTVDIDDMGPQTPLLSLPLDSLRLVELMSRVEDRFRVYIPEQAAFGFATIGDVVEHVRAKSEAKAARAAGRQAAG
ncbi:phosphopantetheine-binding protein [Actinokineospora guangxiensis]|jgi:acyl carrier protein|uniref:Phosphopantetheine-binding protein n=1 Tax=Actinokineospora guangxiensis TaxID=1490288 RepID=A0ABW0EQM5_9PSEU